jgi:PIN domain nuclease of toxin-antitoxin system
VNRLLDTHILLWSVQEPERLSVAAQAAILDPSATILFSAVNIWEVAIKHALRKPGFDVDPSALRTGLLDLGYSELPVTSLHSIEVAGLPMVHKDPFDRLLVAQVIVEGFELITSDNLIARYPGPILKV